MLPLKRPSEYAGLLPCPATGFVGVGGGTGDAGPADQALQYRPDPRPDGTLIVDPEIHLPSVGMDVDIAYFYNSSNLPDMGYGHARTINLNLWLRSRQLSDGTPLVELARGDGSLVSYLYSNTTGQYEPQTSGLVNRLVRDDAQHMWREITPDGRVMSYPVTSDGPPTFITTIADAVGNTHTFLYAYNRLSALQDAVGRYVTFTHDADSGLLTTIQDWAERLTTFTYDTTTAAGMNLLETVQGPSGCITEYGYNASGQLTSVTNPEGYRTNFGYDDFGRATSKQVVGEGTWQYDYPQDPVLEQDSSVVQTPEAVITTQTLAPGANPGRIVDAAGNYVSFTYNARGLETSRTDAYGATWSTEYDNVGITPIANTDPLGHRTEFTLDVYNNNTGVIFPDATRVTYLYGYPGSPYDMTGAKRRLQVAVDQLGHRTSYAYNARGQMVSEQDALGYITTYIYNSLGQQIAVQDALGRFTSYSYDLAGNVKTEMDARGAITTTVYDEQNRPTETMDPRGHVTTSVYDGIGNLIAMVDALGNRTTTTYNAFGSIATQQDANGNISSWEYDSQGRVVAAVNPLGGRETTLYDESGRVSATINAFGGVTTLIYDQAGRVEAVINPLGHLTGTAYDQAGRAIVRIDAYDRRTTTVYDVNDRVIATIDPLGYYATLSYDDAGRLTASIDQFGRRTTSTYDDIGQVLSIQDPLGNTSSTVYDALGRRWASIDPLGYRTTTQYGLTSLALATQNALGYVTSYSYDLAGNPTAMMDPLGHITTTNYDEVNRPFESIDALGHVTTTGYDAVGNPKVSIDALGYRTTSTYNGLGLQITEQDANGFTSSWEYGPAGQLTAAVDAEDDRTTNVYNEAGYVKAVIDAVGGITTQTYDLADRPEAVTDPLGHITTSVYDPRGLRIGQVNALGHRVSASYDRAGRLETQTDQLGYVTSFSYDLAGRLIATQDRAGRTSALEYDAASQVKAAVDALGQRTTTSYDALGRVRATVDARGAVTSTSYDPAGRLEAVVDALGYRTTLAYDAADRQTNITDARGYVTTQNYDAADRLRSVLNPVGELTTFTLDPAGQVTASTDDLNRTTTFAYDKNGQVVGTQTPLGFWSTTVYDALGRRTAEIDALGHQTSWNYDLAGRLTYEQNALGYRTSFTYDELNRRLQVVAANGGITSYAYDERNDLIQEWNPLGAAQQYVRDYPLSNVRAYIDGRGVVTTTSYDDLDRPEARLYGDGTRCTFTYDETGNLTQASESYGVTAMTYDLLGQQRSVARPVGGTLTYTYDGNGNRQTLLDGDGRRTTYTYDGLDRLATLQSPLSSGTFQFSYDQFFNATSAVDTMILPGTAGTEKRFHTNDGYVRDQTFQIGATTTYLSRYLATYDGAGRRQVAQEFLTGVRTTYSYDVTDQLTNESRSGANAYNLTYTYDPMGNRTLLNDGGQLTTYTYDTFNRLLNQVNPDGSLTTYSYDGAGNRTLEQTGSALTTYIWDAQGRLSGFVPPTGDSESYAYDYTGLRRQKTVGSTTTNFVFDWANLLMETDGAGALQALYLNRPDEMRSPLAQLRGSDLRYYATDLQESVRNLLQPGTPISISDTYLYTSFGKWLASSGSTVNPFQFEGGYGYYSDAASRIYVRARYYDPILGRWGSADPIGFDGWNFNTYMYALNNSVMYVDPLGLASKKTKRKAQAKMAKAMEEKETGEKTFSLEEMQHYDCGELEALINNAVEGDGSLYGDHNQNLPTRHWLLRKDPGNLYGWKDRNFRASANAFPHNPAHPHKKSWEGHIIQYNDKQAILQKAIKRFDDMDCNDQDKPGGGKYCVSQKARFWSTNPAPAAPDNPTAARPKSEIPVQKRGKQFVKQSNARAMYYPLNGDPAINSILERLQRHEISREMAIQSIRAEIEYKRAMSLKFQHETMISSAMMQAMSDARAGDDLDMVPDFDTGLEHEFDRFTVPQLTIPKNTVPQNRPGRAPKLKPAYGF